MHRSLRNAKWFLKRSLSTGLVTLFLIGTGLAQDDAVNIAQLTTRLTTTPGDTALREQIIKLANETKPPPAIPEEARRHFVEAAAITKNAKDAAGQKLAIESYEKALSIAPWWGDAYYNLSVAQELIGEWNRAQASLKFYILTGPGEKESRSAQDRIYAIDGKKKVAELEARAQGTKEAEKRAAEERRKREEEAAFWRGPWKSTVINQYGTGTNINVRGELGSDGVLKFYDGANLGVPFLRGYLQATATQVNWTFNASQCGDWTVSVSLSPDKRRIEFQSPECYHPERGKAYFARTRFSWSLTRL